MIDTVTDSELLLAQFGRLMQELQRGNISRNCFQPWEIDILLDVESCNLKESGRRETLRKYYNTVRARMERGLDATPMKLSEYLRRRNHRNGNSR